MAAEKYEGGVAGKSTNNPGEVPPVIAGPDAQNEAAAATLRASMHERHGASVADVVKTAIPRHPEMKLGEPSTILKTGSMAYGETLGTGVAVGAAGSLFGFEWGRKLMQGIFKGFAPLEAVFLFPNLLEGIGKFIRDGKFELGVGGKGGGGGGDHGGGGGAH
jgi:hypothetical protein